MICACCNLPVEERQAKRSNYCRVCESSGCTAHHENHSEVRLSDHYSKELVTFRTGGVGDDLEVAPEQ
jgi:hypothetical protein